jgi:heat shock protein HspQ
VDNQIDSNQQSSYVLRCKLFTEISGDAQERPEIKELFRRIIRINLQ